MKAALPAVLILAPRAASACAICFGAVDAQKDFFTGLGWAILTLVAVTMCLIAGIGYTMWTVERSRKRAEKRA